MVSIEPVACKCTSCGYIIGQVANIWIRIGKRYLGPLADLDNSLSALQQGPDWLGTKGSLTEGCELQDQVCNQCRALLGIKCLSTPVHHPLAEYGTSPLPLPPLGSCTICYVT